MNRKVVEVFSTTGKPIVVAVADSYSELSTNYDNDFNPLDWEATSIGVVQEDGALAFYMLGLDGTWAGVNEEEAQEG